MDKIILRKKILDLGYVNSNFISLCHKYNCDFKSQNDLMKKVGWKNIMEILFNENIGTTVFNESELYKSYEEIFDRQIDQNNSFIKTYKIDDSFGVFLDSSIYLFHLFPKGNLSTDIVPWYYSDGQIYLGDSWWENDDEILDNLKNLSIIDFYKLYKGWAFSDKKLF